MTRAQAQAPRGCTATQELAGPSGTGLLARTTGQKGCLAEALGL